MIYLISEIKEQTVTTTTYIAMTAITCAAIASFPKIVILGCATVSAFAYNKLARIVEHSEYRLSYTSLIEKKINDLPNLKKDALTFLKEKFTENIQGLRSLEKFLILEEWSSFRIFLLKKCNKILNTQTLFNNKISCLEAKLHAGALLENLTPFITKHAEYVSDLQNMRNILKLLEENSFLKRSEKILTNAEEQVNLFFKKMELFSRK